MSDKGWRKKIQGKPLRDLPPLKTTPNVITTAEEQSRERHRPLGWRKTMQSSRPPTPSTISPMTPLVDDTDEARSEHSEPQTPRRNSKPKLARYTSLFNTFRETSKGPEFAEPWSEDAPPPLPSCADPLHALQSVHSHMMQFSTPVPLEYSSCLFRVFEDYRKVREEKERVEGLLQATLTSWKEAEMGWVESEVCYMKEIRRLELLIAKGTSGMTGLFEARQGTIIKRRGGDQKKIPTDERFPKFMSVPNVQIEDELESRDRHKFLGRPLSPSEKMAALSRFLSNNSKEQRLAGRLDGNKKSTLSCNVQSEVAFTGMAARNDICPNPDPKLLLLHGSQDDPMPVRPTLSPVMVETAFESEWSNALRELSGLIARRRGTELEEEIIDQVMNLLSSTDVAAYLKSTKEPNQQHLSTVGGLSNYGHSTRRNLGSAPSQPPLSPAQKRRRHFSFELGDDQLEPTEREVNSSGHGTLKGKSAGAWMTPLVREESIAARPQSTVSIRSSQTLSGELHRVSKIPSPVDTLGRARQEDSGSKGQPVPVGRTGRRQDSHSSVQTMFREPSQTGGRAGWVHGSSSVHQVRAVKLAEVGAEETGEAWHSEDCAALAMEVVGGAEGRQNPGGHASTTSSALSSTAGWKV